jgi:hypothetical protein
MMAAHAKNRDLQNGSIVTTGSANAQAFISGLSYTSVPPGLRVLLKIGFTNTGPATLEMDGTGTALVQSQTGGGLTGGELTVGARAEFIYDGTNWILLYSPVVTWSTGDAKLTFKIAADTGWILCDDGSIGNATSGATTRANADTEALFTLFYTNIVALVVQDSSGATVTRGSSAAVDYAANRRLVIPKTLGRSLAGAGAGAGLSARALGSIAGAETETQTIAQMAPHTHALFWVTAGSGFAGGSDFNFGSSVPYMVTTSTGGGAPLNILDPTIYINVMVKL